MHYLVKDDTGKELTTTLTRKETGAVIDCSNATVRLRARKRNTTQILAVTIGSGANNALGIVVFPLTSLCALDAGYYEAEVSITYNDTGFIETPQEILTFHLREDFG